MGRVVDVRSSVLERTSDEPLYEQIVKAIRQAIAAGEISPHDELPSSRELARDLCVSRATVVQAYEILAQQGVLRSHQGARSTIQPAAAGLRANFNDAEIDKAFSARLQQPSILRPRLAPADHVSASTRRHLFQLQARVTKALKPERSGCARLRENIATYLRLSRSLSCRPENVLAVPSVQQGLMMAALVLRDERRNIQIDPSCSEQVISLFKVVGCGLVQRRLLPGKGFAAGALFVTPSHSFPAATTLTLEERFALMAILECADIRIIEDGRDAEFIDHRDRPSLYELRQGLGTIYIGSLSTVLISSLQISYLLAEPALIDKLARLMFVMDQISPEIESTVAELLESGMFHALANAARQIAKRRCYSFYSEAERYDCWELPALADRQGLHGALHFRIREHSAHCDLRKQLARLDEGYQLFSAAGGNEHRVSLAIGFAATPDAEIPKQVWQLADVIKSFAA